MGLTLPNSLFAKSELEDNYPIILLNIQFCKKSNLWDIKAAYWEELGVVPVIGVNWSFYSD